MPEQLQPITIQAPGFRGLNLQDSTIREQEGWALVADNCVFDDAGSIASRKGYTRVNSSDTLATDIVKVAEYRLDASTSKIISTTATKVYEGTGTTLTDRTPGTTPTAGLWKFVSFADVTTYSGAPIVIGVQEGHMPIIWDGVAGTFVNVDTGVFAGLEETSAGALDGFPINGNEILAAFGRVWVVGEDKQHISWCPLKDVADNATTNSFQKSGSGYLDLTSVWPDGVDYVQALAAFNDKLIIFGEHSILVYNNPYTPDDTATPLTLDTTNQLGGTIAGIGCIARDSVQYIGDDMLFLSHLGVRSLKRSLITESLPTNDVSKNNRDDLMSFANSVTNRNSIDSVYNQTEGFYLISFPFGSGSELNTVCYYIDTKIELEGGARRMTKWPSVNLNSVCYSNTDVMYFGTGDGFLAQYTGYQDNSVSYNMEYISTWRDFNSANLKFPKKIKMIVNGGSTYTINFKWAFDFSDEYHSHPTSVVGASQNPDEYNVTESEYGSQPYANYTQWAASTEHSLYDIVVPTAGDNGYIYWCSTAGTTGSSEPTWNTSSPSGTTADNTAVWTTSAISTYMTEWSGTANLSSSVGAHMHNNGQHIRYGWSVPIDGNEFSVQRMDMFVKLGRLNR